MRNLALLSLVYLFAKSIIYLLNITNLPTSLAATSAVPTFTLYSSHAMHVAVNASVSLSPQVMGRGHGEMERERKMGFTNIFIVNQDF